MRGTCDGHCRRRRAGRGSHRLRVRSLRHRRPVRDEGKSGYELGDGAPEGIVAAKSAATASVGGALVPLLTMGIPGSGATAIILARIPAAWDPARPAGLRQSTAPHLHGLRRGVRWRRSACAFSATSRSSRCARCWTHRRRWCPRSWWCSASWALSLRAAISSDLYVMAAFGLVGFLFERFKFPIAPLVLGTILGPLRGNELHDDDGELQQRLDGVLHAADQWHDPGARDRRPRVSAAAHDLGTPARAARITRMAEPAMNDLR